MVVVDDRPQKKRPAGGRVFPEKDRSPTSILPEPLPPSALSSALRNGRWRWWERCDPAPPGSPPAAALCAWPGAGLRRPGARHLVDQVPVDIERTQVPSSMSCTRWLSQILSYSVRGADISQSSLRVFGPKEKNSAERRGRKARAAHGWTPTLQRFSLRQLHVESGIDSLGHWRLLLVRFGSAASNPGPIKKRLSECLG